MTAKTIGGVLLVGVLAAGCAFAYVHEDYDWRDRSEAREIAREAREHAREVARGGERILLELLARLRHVETPADHAAAAIDPGAARRRKKS